jgi:adenine deaminase
MLVERHINKIVAKLISEGYNLFDVLRSCTVNPAAHYGLDAGLLRQGEPADFIVVNDYRKMDVIQTWIDGKKVYDNGMVMFDYKGAEPVNKFNCSEINPDDIKIIRTENKIRVIEAFDGELITKEFISEVATTEFVEPDTDKDILKIIVKDRYNDAPPATGFVKGFSLKKGAFASSVAHDSHNIICTGTNDEDIVNAVNKVVKMKGGLVVADGIQISSLPLPVAGIMSDQPVDIVADEYKKLSDKVKELGCMMAAPFMTLSFMALLVIPELKLSDRGLFNGREFRHVPLFME